MSQLKKYINIYINNLKDKFIFNLKNIKDI